MIIYYSGDGSDWSQPEIAMGNRATLMLTYFTFSKHNKPSTRFRGILKARKAQLRKGRQRESQP